MTRDKVTLYFDSFKNKVLKIKTDQFYAEIINGECIINLFCNLLVDINKIILYLINIDEFIFKSNINNNLLDDEIMFGFFNDYFRGSHISKTSCMHLFYYIMFNYKIQIDNKRLVISNLMINKSFTKKKRWIMTKKKNICDLISKFIFPNSNIIRKINMCDICMNTKKVFLLSKCNHMFCIQCIVDGIINNITRCFMCKRDHLRQF